MGEIDKAWKKWRDTGKIVNKDHYLVVPPIHTVYSSKATKYKTTMDFILERDEMFENYFYKPLREYANVFKQKDSTSGTTDPGNDNRDK